jgi:glycosyltransferase involved in cell wall biosynthesis
VRVGLISSCVPLVFGGARNIVDWLHDKLTERGVHSEVVYLPSTDEPRTILEQMAAFRLISLENYFDRVITFRPPAHVVRHANKVAWFIHHIRLYYDLWESSFNPLPDTAPSRALREAIMRADTAALSEARAVYANSRTVQERLLRYNRIRSEVLYPPLARPETFYSGPYGEEIVCVSRMEPHKRQDLLLDAMRYVRSGVRLRLCGASMSPGYVASLRGRIARHGLGDKVILEDRWISEEEKAQRLAGALALAYVPLDEDSYGYPTLEAAQAQRCTVTVSDAGGLLEFVVPDVCGLVTPPTPQGLAEAFDRLYADRRLARDLGRAAHRRLDDLGIGWDRVVDTLLA